MGLDGTHWSVPGELGEEIAKPLSIIIISPDKWGGSGQLEVNHCGN